MAYDFTQALAAAKAAVEGSSSGEGKSYRYPLIYPGAGNTIVLRILFNPASGQIMRLVNRHEKIPCYRSYNQDCPICKVMQDVKDLTGTDPFGRTKASKARGIAYAQYISSAMPISKSGNQGNINPGETVLLMFPWSVYTQINALIQAVSQSPTGMDQAFCHADSGLFIQISVSNDFRYTTTSVPYMTFASGKSDEQFLKELDEMPNLLEEVIPSTITSEVETQVKEYADAIYRQYIVPRTPSQAPQVAPQAMSQQFMNPPTDLPFNNPTSVVPQAVVVPPAPTPVPTPVPVVSPVVIPQPSANPQCFGNHAPGSPQCICCPVEVQCSSASGK